MSQKYFIFQNKIKPIWRTCEISCGRQLMRDNFKCNENVYAENNTNTWAKTKAWYYFNSVTVTVSKDEAAWPSVDNTEDLSLPYLHSWVAGGTDAPRNSWSFRWVCCARVVSEAMMNVAVSADFQIHLLAGCSCLSAPDAVLQPRSRSSKGTELCHVSYNTHQVPAGCFQPLSAEP